MNNPIERVFVDMDGVLTDFVGASLRLYDRTDLFLDWPAGERDIPKVLGLSRTQFWNLIDSQGAEFWESLEPYAWFQELVDLAREFAPLTILTAPSIAPSCLEGKVRWLYAHFPKVKGRHFTDFLIGSQKFLLAGPKRVLIDDAEAQVEAFRTAGGKAILFPQNWNENYAVSNRIGYVREALERITKN